MEINKDLIPNKIDKDFIIGSVKSKNLFNVKGLSFRQMSNGADGRIDWNTNTIYVSGYYHQSTQTLKELCPDMIAGQSYFLSFNSSPAAVNNFIYLSGGGGIWNNGTSKMITQNDLDGRINFYGGNDDLTTEYVITNFQIEKGTQKSDYSLHQNFDIGYTKGSFTPTIKGATSAGTATYSRQDGNFIIIGNVVFYQFRIGCTLTDSTGMLLIDGLPSLGAAYEPSGGICFLGSFPDIDDQHLFILRKYYNYLSIDKGNLSSLTNLNWSTTRYIYGSGFYFLP